MSSLMLLPFVFAWAADEEKSVLRYVKPAGNSYVLESEVTITKGKSGSTYSSRTVRGTETLVLRVDRGLKGELLRADIVHAKGESQTRALLEAKEGKFVLSRDGKREEIDVKAPTIFTTAPDWSDLFEMAARMDLKKEGKQEFIGVWFHPTQPTQLPKFSMERLGTDKIQVVGKEVELTRCRGRIRGGSAYLVWVFADGRVCKLATDGGKGSVVVLQGYEKEAMKLK